ncbi:hypothetical protein [Candidatus Entotheonella palauensis]|uniref:hypothetical protein n=1 Tax=Candidatus Entotheonella palauensis TaxID=93172 RepID=UPI0015C47B9C|nr:hypothetical protein [Candidatus Entotheonella palauensis]
MRRWYLAPLAGFILACLWAPPGHTQTSFVKAKPETLELVGTDGAITGSLQLMVTTAISHVKVFVSDLSDATGDGRQRDPLPSSTIKLLPAAKFDTLGDHSLTQVVVQVAKPAVAGLYTGSLTVHWTQPSSGQLEIPIQVRARKKPALAVQEPANPSEMTINATTGDRVQRHILLRETTGEANISRLRAVPLQLLETNRQNAIPASQVQVNLPQEQVSGGELVKAALAIDLGQVAAGAYTGHVIFTAEPNLLLTLPVRVNLRHGWFWPTLVVVVGVLLGLGISAYRTSGRRRDELIVRIAELRETLDDDRALQEGFGSKINSLVEEATAAVRRANWEEAEQSLTAAEQLISKWRSAPQDWANQLQYLRRDLLKPLNQQIDHLSVEQVPRAIRILSHRVQDALSNAADFDTPRSLRERILELEQKFIKFNYFQERIKRLGTWRAELDSGSSRPDDATRDQWTRAEQDLSERLRLIGLDTEEEWDELERDIKAQEDTLASYREQQNDDRAGTILTRSSSAEAMALTQPDALLPALVQVNIRNPQAALWRLQVFHIMTYLLGGLLLSAVGLNTLYVNKPTFGANLLSDYLSLLLFGLGAQTTFSSVAGMVQNWGLPFTQMKP